MEHLTRTRVDRFSIEDSLTLDQLEQLRDQAAVESCILGGGSPAVLSASWMSAGSRFPFTQRKSLLCKTSGLESVRPVEGRG